MRRSPGRILRAAVVVVGWLPVLCTSAAGASAAVSPQDGGLGLSPGRVVTLVKGDLPQDVREPFRAALSPDGRLFLTDRKKGDVLWFDENLVWQGNLAALHPEGSLGRPVRTAFDSDGRIFVADEKSRQILVFEGDAFAGAWGGRGDVPGRFGSLDDIAVDADGMVWAADADRGRLYVFTPEGMLERVVPAFEGAILKQPRLVAVDSAGNVFVYDTDLKAVLKGRRDGRLEWALDLDETLDGKELYDLAVDPAGVAFLVLRDDSRVAIVEPWGSIRTEIFGKSGRPSSFDRLTGLSVSRDGRSMHLVDQKDLVIQEVRIQGAGGSAQRALRRTHIGVVVDTLDGRPLAISPGLTPGDDRWLVRESGGLVIRSAGGENLGPVTLPGALPDRPVAVGTAEGFVVVDRDRTAHRISRDGSRVSAISRSTAGGEIKRPEALAWRAADGALAVYDRDDDEIQLLAADGSFLQRIGRKGKRDGEISKVVGLAFAADGRLFVLDREGERVQVFDEHGIFTAAGPPLTFGVRERSLAVGIGADAWGRIFLLDEYSGLAVQVGAEGIQCQVGAPWLVAEPRSMAVTPGGDMVVAGGEDDERAVVFRCDGAPPAPRRVRLTPSAERTGPVLRWAPGTPGAASFEIYRGRGDEDGLRIGRSDESMFALPPEAWGREPSDLWVRGVTADGRRGRRSAPVLDRITPALLALTSGGDAAAAEGWLAEELALAREAGRTDVVALQAAYLEAILAQGEFDRASAALETFEAGLDERTTADLRLRIARTAIAGSIAAEAGDVALRWVGLLERGTDGTLSAVERGALELEAAGQADAGAALLVRHGRAGELDDVELTRAVADAQLAVGRPGEALKTLFAAGRAAEGVTIRNSIDQNVFQVSTFVVDGVLAEELAPDMGLSPEQQVESVLRELRAYLAETGRAVPGRGDDDAEGAPADGDVDQTWSLRLEALEAKPRIHGAMELEASDPEAAREIYGDILDRTAFLTGPDEIRVRSHLGALALARGDEVEATAEFESVLGLSPDWSPDPDEFSPSVRDFVAGLVAGQAEDGLAEDGP